MIYVLATYIIHPNSKNSNKAKLVKSMYRVYHESQGFSWLKSWIYVFRYALYSKKKIDSEMAYGSCLIYGYGLFIYAEETLAEIDVLIRYYSNIIRDL